MQKNVFFNKIKGGGRDFSTPLKKSPLDGETSPGGGVGWPSKIENENDRNREKTALESGFGHLKFPNVL